MNNEEKYKLALFAVIRNNHVMPMGLKMGISMPEIDQMAKEVMDRIIGMCDFDKLRKSFYGEAEHGCD